MKSAPFVGQLECQGQSKGQKTKLRQICPDGPFSAYFFISKTPARSVRSVRSVVKKKELTTENTERRGTRIMANTPTPNASYSLTLRVRIHNQPGKLGEITTAIGKAGGDIEGIDIVSVGKDFLIRDITVNAASESHDQEIIAAVHDIDGVEV